MMKNFFKKNFMGLQAFSGKLVQCLIFLKKIIKKKISKNRIVGKKFFGIPGGLIFMGKTVPLKF